MEEPSILGRSSLSQRYKVTKMQYMFKVDGPLGYKALYFHCPKTVLFHEIFFLTTIGPIKKALIFKIFHKVKCLVSG